MTDVEMKIEVDAEDFTEELSDEALEVGNSSVARVLMCVCGCSCSSPSR